MSSTLTCWNTVPFATHGLMSIAVLRRPSLLKSKGLPEPHFTVWGHSAIYLGMSERQG